MMIKKYVAIGIVALILLGICSMGLGLSKITETSEIEGERNTDDALLSENVVEVVIDPEEDQVVDAGVKLEFNATGLNEDGDVIEDNPENFEWDNTKSNGVFYKTQTGEYEVTATYDGVTSESTLVEVVAAEVANFWIGPEEATIEAGESQEYTATAEDQYGNEFDVTDETEWLDDVDPGEDSYWVGSEITVNKTDSWEITGEYETEGGESFTDTSTLNVDFADVDYVKIEPDGEVTVTAGEELMFDAWAYDEHDNLITDYFADFEWENTKSNGVFYKTEAGEYKVTATYDGVVSDPTTVTVEPAEAAGFLIGPEEATIEAGESQEYTATAEDQYGNEFDVTDETEWSDDVDPEDASSWEEDNIITVTQVGIWEITGEYQEFNDTTNLTVEPAEAVDFCIVPEEAEIFAGEPHNYTAYAEDYYGNAINVTEETIWSIDEDAGGQWDQTTGVYTSEFAGAWNITGEFQEFNDTANLTVEPSNPDYIVISPEESTITAGESENYTATLYDQFGNEIGDVTDETEWSDDVDPEDASSWEENKITINKTSTWEITGEYEEFNDTANLTVEPAEVVDIRIEPEEATVDAGDSQAYTAIAEDQYGNEFDVTDETEWSIDEDAGGQWNQTTGVYTSEIAGTWNITGEYENNTHILSDTVNLTVEPAGPDHIGISPDGTTIRAGESENYTATLYDQFGNEIGDVTDETEWSDDVHPEEDSYWVGSEITVNKTDSWEIIGVYEEFVDTAELNVEPAEAADFWIGPGEATIDAGESQEYTATAEDQYGNEFEVTGETTWSDDIDESDWTNNEITAYTAGDDWVITGEYGIFEDTATLHVEHGELEYVQIYPGEDQTITAGESTNFSAGAYDAHDNLITDDINDFEWVNAPTGDFNKTTVGDYDVTAEYEGVISEPTTVTVEPADVDYILIDPIDDQRVKVGEELEFTAEAYDQYDNLIEDDPEEFTWKNAPGGVFEEFEAGEYEVRAEYDGVSSETVTVNNASDVKPATILITVILTSVVGIAVFKKIGGGK